MEIKFTKGDIYSYLRQNTHCVMISERPWHLQYTIHMDMEQNLVDGFSGCVVNFTAFRDMLAMDAGANKSLLDVVDDLYSQAVAFFEINWGTR